MFKKKIMKKIFVLLVSIGVLIFVACNKLPFVTKEPTACIDGPLIVEEYQGATYSYCGENADDFEWSVNGGGILGTSKTFVPTFTARGKYVIVLKAKNKKFEKTTSVEVEYGKTAKTTCLITNLCGNSDNLSDPSEISYYWAYLYDSKADWSTDVSNGEHKLVKDSLQCQYSSAAKTAFVTFTKPYAVGSKKYISIEYRNPSKPNSNITNWAGLFKGTSGSVDINHNAFNDNNCATVLDNYSKQVFMGKWLLIRYDDFSAAPLGCKDDDYLKFYANGTWKYFLGPDNCNGGAEESTGTLTDLPTCSSNTYFGQVIKTSQGPFETQTWSIYFPDSMKIFTQGAVFADYTFKYVK